MNELSKLSEEDFFEYSRLMDEYREYREEADPETSGGGVRGWCLMKHANECLDKAKALLEKVK